MDGSFSAAATVLAAVLCACSSSDDAHTPATASGGGVAATGGAAALGSGGSATGTGGSAPSAGGAGKTPPASNGGSALSSTGGSTTAGVAGSGPSGTGGAATLGTGGSNSKDDAGPSAGGSAPIPGTPRLFYLDTLAGRVLSADPSGTDVKVLVTGATGGPDGIAVDVVGKHVFWTNMGVPSADDGYVDRTNLDGTSLTAIVPAGGTFTPKQLKLDEKNGKLYWSDREGMRVMRSNLDGTGIETLIESAEGNTARQDASNWCVGIALDVGRSQIYWTQKGGDNAGVGSIRRAALEIPSGTDAAHRTDIQVLFDGLPEPIDLDVDLGSRTMYWTDRGNPPRGNSVSSAPMDPPSGFDPRARSDQKILVSNLKEGIGIALDVANSRMFFTDLSGTVYTSKLDGSGNRALITGQGVLTGIAYVSLPR